MAHCNGPRSKAYSNSSSGIDVKFYIDTGHERCCITAASQQCSWQQQPKEMPWQLRSSQAWLSNGAAALLPLLALSMRPMHAWVFRSKSAHATSGLSSDCEALCF
mmetsp:Transcript_26336/g.51616  ORF Transcript_26336/g.51616 Transcript_26336/m.51616 type:complete len:105 (-) Transcript_26336:43-357(-)